MLFAWALPLAVSVRPQQCIQHRWFGLRFERFETGVVGAVMVSCVQCTCWGEDACRAVSDIRGIDSCRSTSEAHIESTCHVERVQFGLNWGAPASLLASGGVLHARFPCLLVGVSPAAHQL